MTNDPTLDDPGTRLRTLGWTATAGGAALRIRSAGTSETRFGRAWTRGGEWESLPGEGAVYGLYAVEGTGTIEANGSESPYAPHRLVLLDGGEPAIVRIQRPTALYLWRFESGMLSAAPVRGRRGGREFPETATAPFRALTNSLLEADPAVAESIYAARASEYLLAAAFAGLDERRPRGSAA
ncbi:hypothetical protein [Rathayibacter tanaceti]|uniref:Transcription regulator HTH AraC- type ligand binding domain-containing protein n=2 Tax=Rathayibacter tanaceti TaxID=1671680 RepID=A0A162GH94_9MICO|nr:hypothetical protein [Rathayibacter tanaceti]KZX21109.1 hypothetical protein ACH61_01765 [Rathayibacter tanaceti]QHC56673.1 hypothetical protein GSU10_14255 [Rathayibacter tanaceti]TCO36176.1 AraC-like protein [Rathayibacter tanaceti]